LIPGARLDHRRSGWTHPTGRLGATALRGSPKRWRRRVNTRHPSIEVDAGFGGATCRDLCAERWGSRLATLEIRGNTDPLPSRATYDPRQAVGGRGETPSDPARRRGFLQSRLAQRAAGGVPELPVSG
jgi:hypothetical protein